MNKISVVINTYNANKYLQRVLDTVKGFDEIVVCDMESTDNTVNIAKQNGCFVVTFPKGDHKCCEPARQYAIDSASHEWVLVVDADELVSPQLQDYLYDFIKHPGEVRGLYIPRTNLTMGIALPATYPDYQLRFFTKEGTVWPPIIHVTPIISGKVEYISRHKRELSLLHLDDSTRAAVNRLNNYTDHEVERRGTVHVSFLKLVFSPLFRFAKMYFFKRGFLYGKAGYIQAMRSMIYKFTMLCKMYEKEKEIF